MYHSTLMGTYGYHLVLVPDWNSHPHARTPYWGVNTGSKEIKLYGVDDHDHRLKEHFIRQADLQYAHEGHYDPPLQEETEPHDKSPVIEQSLEQILEDTNIRTAKEKTPTTEKPSNQPVTTYI
mgnify:CR=1 FL=1